MLFLVLFLKVIEELHSCILLFAQKLLKIRLVLAVLQTHDYGSFDQVCRAVVLFPRKLDADLAHL